MNSEDKFRELLNEKIGGKEFPFNAANWEKAQQMIDASREKKKRRAAVLWLLLLFTLGTGTYLVWNLQPETKGMADNITPAPTDHVQPAAEVKDIAPQQKETPALKTNSPETPVNTLETGTQHQAETIKPMVVETEPTHENVASTTKSRKDKPSEAHTTQPSNLETKPVKQSQPGKLPAPPAATIAMEQPGDKADGQKNTDLTKTEAMESAEKAPAKAKQEESPIAKNEEAPTSALPEPIVAATNTGTVTDQKQEQAPPGVVDVDPITPPVTPNTLTEPPVVVKDSSMVAVTDATQVAFKQPSYPKHIFFVEAGANYMAGWQTTQKRDANGFNPIAGIGYINYFTETMGLSVGLNYTSIGNLGAYSHTSKVSTLGFGEESAVTVITPVKLHYLAVPLRLNVALDSKNTFGLGYTFAYLLAVDSKLETYDQKMSYEQNGMVKSGFSQSKGRGYSEGFSAFDSQLSVFYRRRLYKELSLNTEMLFGLSDIKNNKFFASNSFERSLGLKVTLMYNLFKK